MEVAMQVEEVVCSGYIESCSGVTAAPYAMVVGAAVSVEEVGTVCEQHPVTALSISGQDVAGRNDVRTAPFSQIESAKSAESYQLVSGKESRNARATATASTR
jgi:hypothetical protein